MSITTNCRICESSISKFMSFGKMPIANGFLLQKDLEAEYFFELAPAFCGSCKTFQLIEQPDPSMMFHDNYAFFSSTSKKMAEHFEKMAGHFYSEFIPDPSQGFAIELGSNDGIMLKHLVKKNIRCLGIEPSSNVAEIARQNGVDTISEFFTDHLAKTLQAEHGYADIISAANVMCHIPDLHSVGRGVDALLKTTGVFIFEDPYLGDVIKKTSYDQIYDEHVFIFSVQSVSNIFSRHNLEVFHVEPQPTHGGSLRYYLGRKGQHPIRESVAKQIKLEDSIGLQNPQTYEDFKLRCEKNRADLRDTLQRLHADGKRVFGYAATSKSTTVLNYCQIGPDLIEFISDTTPIKHNTVSPGMHIPVRPYESFKNNYPDYAVLFAWNHSQEIFENERAYRESGGKWVIFVPEVKVI